MISSDDGLISPISSATYPQTPIRPPPHLLAFTIPAIQNRHHPARLYTKSKPAPTPGRLEQATLALGVHLTDLSVLGI